MTTLEPLDRIAELGQELIELSSLMKEKQVGISDANSAITPQKLFREFQMCEARIVAIAAELRVIIAGHKGI